MRQRLQSLLKELNQGLVDREDALKFALLTVLAGENLVLIGPPGTGKSLIARRIADCFKSGKPSKSDYFEYLLTKFSTPEEIFGPLSISELKQDRFKRNTEGYLPTVRIAFLDEIFKASSSILNALLTILNERVYHNGSQAEKVPLQALIAASNELPTGQEELNALYDRFLVRCYVGYVPEDSLSRLFEVSAGADVQGRLSAEDLAAIRHAAQAVTLPQPVRECIESIWLQLREMFKEDRREQLSDRRLIKILSLLRVSAATNERTEVDLSDLLLLKDCLWSHPDNAGKVVELLRNTLQRKSLTLPQVAPDTDSLAATPSTPSTTRNLLPGYRGSGTIEDPVLISELDDLLGLDRPDIGLKGYYFRQTADIDISAIKTWHAIPFKGHYNGGNFTIKGHTASKTLFDSIQPDSSIQLVQLADLSLAATAEKSEIWACNSNKRLFEKEITACNITACESAGIASSATDCTIQACRSSAILIPDIASNCTITNCQVVINYKGDANLLAGGITKMLTAGSRVTSCTVSGKLLYANARSNPLQFSGIAAQVSDSSISNCLVGPLWVSGTNVRIDGICKDSTSSTLISNYVLDSVEKSIHPYQLLANFTLIKANLGAHLEDTKNDPSGGSLSEADCNQYFLEHTLQWDFTNTWEWDTVRSSPNLRKPNHSSHPITLLEKPSNASNADLLTQQIRRNIWL